MMTEEEHGQIKAKAWRTLKAVDHVDAKATDEGLTISPEWRAWRSQVRAVIRGERMNIPNEPVRYLGRAIPEPVCEPEPILEPELIEVAPPVVKDIPIYSFRKYLRTVPNDKPSEAEGTPVFEDVKPETEAVVETVDQPEPPLILPTRPTINDVPSTVMFSFSAPDLQNENDALRQRIAELEATLAAPVLELSNEPPAEALLEAYPDEDHAALKARILAEFASLRNMLVGHIPMTPEQLNRLVALEHPKYQSWLQGVTQ